jgi:hypothetical protein
VRTLWLPRQDDHREHVQLRHGRAHLAEDLRLLHAGVLDRKSFRNGYRPMVNPVEVRSTSLVADDAAIDPSLLANSPEAFTEPKLRKDGCWGDAAFGMRRRCWREIRRQHNLQLTVGKNQVQRIQSFGDVGAASLAGTAYTGSGSTSPTATTWTQSGTTFPTATSSAGNTGLQGHVLFVANGVTTGAFTNPVMGVILSNTTSAITVDQWYALPLTGAAGTTPALSSAGWVLPGGSLAWWVALTTDSGAPAAGDVTRTADGLWGSGSSSGTATELVSGTYAGMGRAYCGQGGGTAPTIPGSAQIQFNHTWTYGGGTIAAVTANKVVLFNSLAAVGTIPVLETLLSAGASFAANGDTIQLAGWSITC